MEDAVVKKKTPKRKIAMALKSASEAIVSISEMDDVVSKMNDKQKLLFESLMMGDDELVAAIKSGHTAYFTGITKVVHDKNGKPLNTKDVSLENVTTLDNDSYQRLLRICTAQVRFVLATDDYRKYTVPIKEYIARLAPLALGTISALARNGVKEETRFRAAKDLLDRAGEGAREPEKDIIIPVQLNIVLTQKDGSEVQYVR